MTARERSSTSALIRYADPEAIRAAVNSYAATIRYQRPEVRSIRWFGSWVNGTWSVGSDVDLCIVVDRSDKPRRERVVDYLPRSFPVGIDLFVYTEQEFEDVKVNHPSFARTMVSGVEV